MNCIVLPSNNEEHVLLGILGNKTSCYVDRVCNADYCLYLKNCFETTELGIGGLFMIGLNIYQLEYWCKNSLCTDFSYSYQHSFTKERYKLNLHILITK